MKFEHEKSKINDYSGVQLAFVGDAVFDLYIRTRLLEEAPYKNIKDLHREKSDLVKANSQAAFAGILKESFSESELDIFKRARNASSKSAPKSSSAVAYRNATGFEALLGALFLQGESERLNEIMDAAYIIGRVESDNG